MTELAARRSYWWRAVGGLTAVALLALAACAPPAPPPAATSPAGLAAAATSAPTGGGGTIVWAITANQLPGIDTVMAGTEGAEGYRAVGKQMYDGLVQYDEATPGAPAKIVGDLSDSWTIDDDASRWTFHLRSNVQFQDGSPWNADAAIYNLDRYLNPSHPQYDQQLAARAASSLSVVDTYRKIDDATLEIKTKKPFRMLLDNLLNVYFGSVKALQAGGSAGFGQHPVGTGPFSFDSIQGNTLTLKANPTYWAGAPKLDRLVIRPIPDPSARLAALQSGEANLIEVPPPEAIESLKQQGYEFSSQEYSHIWAIFLNVHYAPWDNVLVREAANYAVDKESLADHVLDGAAAAPYSLTTKDDPWFDPSIGGYPYDPEKARTLLAQAGYSNGLDTTFEYPTSGSGNMWPDPIIQSVQANLAAVGIRIRTDPLEWTALSTAFNVGNWPMTIGGYAISRGTYNRNLWVTDYTQGNREGYASAAIDSLFQQAMAEPDETKYNDDWKGIHKQVMQDAPLILVTRDKQVRVMSPKVHGFIQAQVNFVDFRSVTVDH